ncbi:MAG: Flp pilus assembly protein CpaB [Parvibaculum sp.]|uniref:Flp pilus assembly protein CpaB n=1 Tax=Parvibaculum sp. TaxID=2024848 RepID=UPI003C794383
MAVVAAGLAALLARGLVSSGDAPEQQKVVEAPTTEVLVASTAIDRGARLSGSDLRWQSWPNSALGPNFVTRQQKPDAIATLTGSLARASISNGEPITDGKIIDVKSGGFMSALVSPGMRAVAVAVSPETGAGGFILPNDRIDVIQTRRVQEDGARGPHEVVHGEILLHNIRVLAIDQRFKDDSGEQVAVGKTATLELTPAQAERVAVAQVEGTLILSLRGLGETDVQVEEVPQQSSTSVIRVVRYGTAQSVRVR